MKDGRWVPGWSETHTQALAPMDFEPVAERADPDSFRCDPPYHRPDCDGKNCDDDETRKLLDEEPPRPTGRPRYRDSDRGMDPGLFN